MSGRMTPARRGCKSEADRDEEPGGLRHRYTARDWRQPGCGAADPAGSEEGSKTQAAELASPPPSLPSPINLLGQGFPETGMSKLSKLREMKNYREAWHAAVYGVVKIRTRQGH